MKNQIIRCKCVDMSVDGQGIAKADKLVVFVKGMIKGEEADVKIIAEKKNYSFGIIDKLIVRSPYRKDLDCPIAYKCGGCDYRHIDYSYQLDLKKEVLINTFPGYKVNDIIGCDDPFYYRNKVQIPVADHKMGFFRKFSNDIVEFEDCLIESKIANEMIADLKKLILNIMSYLLSDEKVDIDLPFLEISAFSIEGFDAQINQAENTIELAMDAEEFKDMDSLRAVKPEITLADPDYSHVYPNEEVDLRFCPYVPKTFVVTDYISRRAYTFSIRLWRKEGIDQTEDESAPVRKEWQNGQIVIIRGNNKYTITGIKIQ